MSFQPNPNNSLNEEQIMRIALKVDVCSRQGAEQGVHNLLALFEQYDVKASFFFSTCLESNSSGILHALSRAKGVFGKTSRSHETTPTPALSKAVLAVLEAGHDAGVKAHDPGDWIKHAAFAGEDWTRLQLALAIDSMQQIMGQAPLMFGAAGWQVNSHLLVREEKLGFSFASDTRGKYPFYPVLQNVHSNCPQIPTTLPTLAEMLGRAGIDTDNVHEYLYSESRYVLPFGHVYSIQADMEGIEHLDIMEKLLVMWKGQEGDVRSLSHIYQELDLKTLPSHQIGWADMEGGTGHIAMQSVQVNA